MSSKIKHFFERHEMLDRLIFWHILGTLAIGIVWTVKTVERASKWITKNPLKFVYEFWWIESAIGFTLYLAVGWELGFWMGTICLPLAFALETYDKFRKKRLAKKKALAAQQLRDKVLVEYAKIKEVIRTSRRAHG